MDDFVLEKNIFSNIFERDIRRVFIYKKAERLAKAIHLVAPAFALSGSLRDRIDSIAIGLVDAAILPPPSARTALAKELLALSSVLAIARSGGLLSPMNAELIREEAQALLQEVASYEEPRLFLEEAPSLSSIAKRATRVPASKKRPRSHNGQKADLKDKGRRDSILAVLKDRKMSFIKDISTLISGVSEKTIQRELAALVAEGVVERKGNRRWTTYSLKVS